VKQKTVIESVAVVVIFCCPAVIFCCFADSRVMEKAVELTNRRQLCMQNIFWNHSFCVAWSQRYGNVVLLIWYRKTTWICY